MSWQAVKWVVHDVNGVSGTEKLVLMVLAETARSDGKNVYLAHSTIAERSCLGVATVKRALKTLEAEGLIRRGNQSVTAHLPPRHRPVVWDLRMRR